MRFAPLIFSALLGCAATAAQAELPEGARAMIDAAIASGDERKVATVIGLARSTWPEERSTIDAINDQWKITLAARRAAEAEAEQTALINAGMFDRWSGEGELGAFQSSGNTESVGVAAALRLDREGIDWTHALRVSADYQRSNGVTSRERYLVAYEPRFEMGENLFAYGLAQYEHDRFQGFDHRYAVSGGVGYTLLESDSATLSIKAGPAYRVTELTDGTRIDRLAALFGADFDWKLADRVTFTQDANAVTETGGEALLIVDSANTTLNLLSGIDFKVSNRLRSRLSYQLEYNSNARQNREQTDTLTRFTLVYGF